jgi:selenocysteine lyase/cysteine desulfurase
MILESLIEKKVKISMRDGNLRISPHFYNLEFEIDRFVEILLSIANQL